mmetsp:Transcript_7890/g.13918  ORF Transcript_7890/g.13918 Transcript_7890/m.13918 type:complete len:1243 (+) Transcript_7890:106-3834(+)
MPPGHQPSLSSSLFAFGPLLAVAVAIGSNIGSVSLLGSLLDTNFLFIDCVQRQRFPLHYLFQIVWIFSSLALLFSGIATLFFLGYFPFETPVACSNPAAVAAGVPTESDESATASASAGPHLWLYECHHNHSSYLCFPPYCAPGGLRSRLFPSVERTTCEIEVADCGSEVEEEEDDLFPLLDPFNIRKKSPSKTSSPPKEYRTTNSTNNPLDLILQSPYLPLPYFVKQSLEGRQYDWNTLGGSKCSFKRNSLAIEKELELASHKSSSFSQLEGDSCCEGDHSASPPKHDQKNEGEEGTLSNHRFRGFGIAAQRLVSQAVSSYYSRELNQTEPQDPAVSSFEYQDKQKQEQKVEVQQEHFRKSPQLQVPSTQQTMTAQQNTEPAPPASAKVHVESDNPAGKPIPQAVLVYHESAHSIVFRDHLRRQQSAIRRTSSHMENSTHPSPDQQMRKQNTQPVTDGTPAPSRAPSTILEVSESDVGYESGGSRGSNRSSHSDRSGGESSSVTSGGSGIIPWGSGSRNYRRVEGGLSKPLKKKASPSPSMQQVVIAGFQPVIEPLESLDLNSSNVFEPLLDADPLKEDNTLEMSDAESEVVELLKNEQAVVKTIRNADWTAFMQKFKPIEEGGSGTHEHHPAHRQQKESNAKKTGEYPFNSFVTSTTILPSCAKKMRCFGSTNEYAIGVVFALPKAFPDDASEDDAAKRTRTWSWPSGYSAKTEFNIDHHGNLTNGREEALVPLSGMRKMNHSYLYDEDYIVGGRMVKGGLTTIPYNEVYIRAGGLGRISGGVDVATGKLCDDADGSGRSFDHGIGLPVALFVREADYGHLVRLLRTRARYSAIFGSDAAQGIPLLFMTPEHGVRVFTEKLQHQVLKKMSWELNPFQNPSLAYRTGIDNTSEPHLQQKLEELLDLDDDTMKQVLTPEEMARIAGGFGATDESVANLLNQAMQRDILEGEGESLRDSGHNLQDLVNEGLSFALRANDYHTSRQLLILYTLVAAKRSSSSESKPLLESDEGYLPDTSRASASSKKWRDAEKNIEKEGGKERHLVRDERTLGKQYAPPPPPPPPLDTDRLRSATNSDGLLAVLGAAQVLRAMQDGSAKRRVKESIDSVEEWIENGEQSVAFRVASWRDQRAAQGDLKIAMENDSNFMAFISNKAISNRKKFAQQLRDASAVTGFDSLQFLKAIHSVSAQMNSPCLRLELLQYILGLDNRYSVAHVTRSVELAATCLNLSESDVFNDEEKKLLE